VKRAGLDRGAQRGVLAEQVLLADELVERARAHARRERAALRLGPFGGAQDASALLWPYAIAYVLVVGAVADLIFRRSDL